MEEIVLTKKVITGVQKRDSGKWVQEENPTYCAIIDYIQRNFEKAQNKIQVIFKFNTDIEDHIHKFYVLPAIKFKVKNVIMTTNH